MKELPRLLDAAAHGSARALLRAGLADAPSEGARARTVAALGLGVATTAVTGTSAAATGKASAGGVLALLAKAGTGGAVVGAVVLVASSSPPPGPPAGVERAVPVPALQPTPQSVSTPSLATPSASASSFSRGPFPEATVRASPNVAPPRPAPSVQRSRGNELEAEVALVDSARRALLRGAPGEALGLLNQHQREHPRGVMHPEAFLLRLDAMVRAGRPAAARAAARRYLEQNPSGVHAERVRKIAGE